MITIDIEWMIILLLAVYSIGLLTKPILEWWANWEKHRIIMGIIWICSAVYRVVTLGKEKRKMKRYFNDSVYGDNYIHAINSWISQITRDREDYEYWPNPQTPKWWRMNKLVAYYYQLMEENIDRCDGTTVCKGCGLDISYPENEDYVCPRCGNDLEGEEE